MSINRTEQGRFAEGHKVPFQWRVKISESMKKRVRERDDFWNAEHISYLRRFYGKVSAIFIAKKLNRGLATVYKKAQELGLKATSHPHVKHVDYRKIYGLRARTRSLEQSRAHKFARNHPELLGVTCEFCGVTKSLVAHHPDYNFPDIIVITCKSCHQWLHKKGG